MSVFDLALATLHADHNTSLPARWRRGGQGAWTELRAIRVVEDATADAFGAKVKTRDDTFQLRVADAGEVGQNDVLELLDADGNPTARLVITGAHKDVEGLTWIVTGTRRM